MKVRNSPEDQPQAMECKLEAKNDCGFEAVFFIATKGPWSQRAQIEATFNDWANCLHEDYCGECKERTA